MAEPDRRRRGAAVGGLVAVLAVVVRNFEIPKVVAEPEIESLWQYANSHNVDVIMGGKESYGSTYWAVWPVFFRSLVDGGSLENSIIPITPRCEPINQQINK